MDWKRKGQGFAGLETPVASSHNVYCNQPGNPSTGQQFMNRDAFQEWLKADNSFLYLPRAPGSGRLTFVSEAIEVIAQKTPNLGHGLAYFYFDPKDLFKQSALNMLCALLLQLSIREGGPARGKYLGSFDLCLDPGKPLPLNVLTRCFYDATQHFALLTSCWMH
ncbi:hypothetical protein N7448_011433 [Penicillium atrosanguineum]|nr:hypothetical protein N7448_011433 [Penicillium atrosanguineum]